MRPDRIPCRIPCRIPRAAALLIAALWALGVGASPALANEKASEYQLKAAFLYQFTKYVAWPDAAGGPVSICVIGDDPFGAALDETLADKTAQGQPIVARRVRAGGTLEGCRILFVSPSAQADLPGTLAALGDSPTLTVADTAGFPSRGGMINLKVAGDRIKLEVNPDNAERVGLKIRSELLRLAEVVRD